MEVARLTGGAYLLLIISFATSSCTSPNPAFVGSGSEGGIAADQGLPGADGVGPAGDGALVLTDGITSPDGPRRDGGPPPDTGAPKDLPSPPEDLPPPKDLPPPPDVLPPDTVPPECTAPAECDDGISCTTDSCTEGSCSNTLKPGGCLIGKLCVGAGAQNPTNSCQQCDPKKNPRAWSLRPDGASCLDDGVPCTNDICKGGSCVHPQDPDWCLIDGACVPDGDTDDSECRMCDTDESTTSWVNFADGEECVEDGKYCTADVCQAGKCNHLVVEGCLIGGACVPEGATKGPCDECIPGQSTTSYTFVAGAPCPSTTGALGAMCAAGQCRAFSEAKLPLPSGTPTASALRAVALVPTGILGAPEVWAGGSLGQAQAGDELGGLIVRLDKAVTAYTTKAPINGLHHRMAVAANGQVFQHGAGAWSEATKLSGQLAGARLAVWGAGLANQVDVHYLVGVENPPASIGVYRCEALFGNTTCTSSYTGVKAGAALAGVHGSLDSVSVGGVSGPVWVINGKGPTDIYYNDGGSTTFTRSAPGGCRDMGNNTKTPCSLTTGNLTDIHGTSASDIWAVGELDIILAYNGKSWKRHWGSVQLGNHELQSIYSSPADDLVSILGYRENNSGRTVVVFNYNTKLDRWFPALDIKHFPTPDFGSVSQITDIAGTGYSNLWLVGRKDSAYAGSEAWILRLK